MASWVESGASGWIRIPPAELDLEATLMCGQAFRWRAANGSSEVGRIQCWQAVVRGQQLEVWREDERVHVRMTPGPWDAVLLDRYFDLGLSLAETCQSIAVDEVIRSALDRFPGLRILQQEPWETLIAFILSQWSNVPRISKQMDALSEQYGREISAGVYAFPTPTELARASAEDLRQLGLGYRADYVQRAARKCADQGVGWLEDLARLSYLEARNRIVLPFSANRPTEKVHGVGPKVADCVLLFSLGHYEAVPVDVHVRRAMERWYGASESFTGSYDSIGDFARRHFGRFAGYAQQYLFHRQRVTSREERKTGQSPSSRGRGSAGNSGASAETSTPRSDSSADAQR